MLRSLFAIIFAVIIGLGAAKFIEGGSKALLSQDAGLWADAFLAVAWTVGAFFAALIALLIGKRWTPLGVLASATIFFSAAVTLATTTLSWLLWPGSLLGTALGGFLALRLTGASKDYTNQSVSQEIFGDE